MHCVQVVLGLISEFHGQVLSHSGVDMLLPVSIFLSTRFLNWGRHLWVAVVGSRSVVHFSPLSTRFLVGLQLVVGDVGELLGLLSKPTVVGGLVMSGPVGVLLRSGLFEEQMHVDFLSLLGRLHLLMKLLFRLLRRLSVLLLLDRLVTSP